MTSKLNCLSYWFPKLEVAGLPVPKTEIVRAPDLDPILDGKMPPAWHGFLTKLQVAVKAVGGYPVFLRTGYGSGKHEWKETCCVPDGNVAGTITMGRHIRALVEWSAIVDFAGLPTDVWAVREMLPTKPICTLPAYGNMPLCREFRCFVRDGEVLCTHAYWPWGAVCDGFPYKYTGDTQERDVPPDLEQAYTEISHLNFKDDLTVRDLASYAGKAVGGEWSVDMLETERGWYLIDMAVAAESWHWDGCKNAKVKV